jgi:hypothetical protein
MDPNPNPDPEPEPEPEPEQEETLILESRIWNLNMNLMKGARKTYVDTDNFLVTVWSG